MKKQYILQVVLIEMKLVSQAITFQLKKKKMRSFDYLGTFYPELGEVSVWCFFARRFPPGCTAFPHLLVGRLSTLNCP